MDDDDLIDEYLQKAESEDGLIVKHNGKYVRIDYDETIDEWSAKFVEPKQRIIYYFE